MTISTIVQKLRFFTLTKSRQYFESDTTPAPVTPSSAATAAASAAAKEPYVLKRDYRASSRSVSNSSNWEARKADVGLQRLNLQFFLWKDTLQFNLHPEIPAPKVNARIADVAMGTG